MPLAERKKTTPRAVSKTAKAKAKTASRAAAKRTSGKHPVPAQDPSSPMLARISSKGQIVIPAALREKYRLSEGVTVMFREENGHIVLDPNRFAALFALRGTFPEDMEGMLIEEKKREREHEDREQW